jgi:trimeric autotransporter adhesin
VVAVVAALTCTAALLPTTVAAQTPSDPTLGRTAARAAVSCWDVKQRDPGAPSGSYWLVTPRMPAPARFHCDMGTDGGGWILIGRGREGWDFSYNGQGNPDQVRAPFDGPEAFAPRTLPARTIDGLLNGGRVDQLPDGIRLRRAVSTDGTSRQEVRLSLARRDRWAWSFGAEHPLGGYRFGTAAGSGGVTAEFGLDQGINRVQTIERESHGWRAGWGLGNTVRGSSAAGAYVWSNAGEGNALPFTQVWIRPRLTASGTTFPAIPAGGTAPITERPVLANDAEPVTWGVAGLANGRSGELNTEVQAFTQSGSRMIVGGNFRWVQRDGAGTGRVEQPYLAAFDVGTGEWVPGFHPRLDGQVKDLHTRADGTIVVAGEFTSANGAPATGIVVLDPTTGATVTSFRLSLENRVAGDTAVLAVDIHGPWLYLGGRFTHLTGGAGTGPVYARMAARVAVGDGTPDGAWNPDLSGTVVDLDASGRGDRVFVGGYFTSAGATPTGEVAVLDTVRGAVPPGLAPPSFSNPRARYQQAVREVGDRVWVGGAEHQLHSYRRSDFARLSTNITKTGGDFQTITDRDGIVYGGCHCGEWNYSGATTWPAIGTSWTQGDNIRFVGAWDAATGAYLPEFVPGLNAARGHGPWASATDSTGATWFGGDFARVRTAGGRWSWAGGFVRYRLRDHVAPTSPTSFTATENGGRTALRWGAATDDRGGVTYEILRDDRVVATTSSRELTLDTRLRPARYAVRAVDGTGNRSASTPPVAVAASPWSFTDIATDTHRRNIEAVYAAGIASGYQDGTFRPGQTVNRGQMATFLANALGLDKSGRSPFPDARGDTHEGAIAAVAAAGIASGYRDGRFGPHDTVTREQMATFLNNALDLPRGTRTFPDVGGTHAAAVSAVATAEIASGYPDGTYRPVAPVSRGHMATFVAKGFKLV